MDDGQTQIACNSDRMAHRVTKTMWWWQTEWDKDSDWQTDWLTDIPYSVTQTDGQIDRHTGRQTERQTEWQWDRQWQTENRRLTDWQAEWRTDRVTDRVTNSDSNNVVTAVDIQEPTQEHRKTGGVNLLNIDLNVLLEIISVKVQVQNLIMHKVISDKSMGLLMALSISLDTDLIRYQRN